MERLDVITLIGIILWTVLLLFCQNRKWFRVVDECKVLYLGPMVLVVLNIILIGIEVNMIGAYVAAGICAVTMFRRKVKLSTMQFVIIVICTLLVIPCVTKLSPVLVAKGKTQFAYRTPNYVDEFEKQFYRMKEHYAFTEYKSIDWDELYDTYMPLMKQAELSKSSFEKMKVWNAFAKSFQDGHTYIFLREGSKNVYDDFSEKSAGNDYGFSTVQLSNGQIVLVNVDPESAIYKDGARDGMELVSFQGKAAGDYHIDPWFYSSSDPEVRAFYGSMAITMVEEEQVSVTYKNQQGEERNLQVHSMGSGVERFEHNYNVFSARTHRSNLSCEMVDDETAVLSLNSMDLPEGVEYEGTLDLDDPYAGIKAYVKNQLAQVKKEGAKNLIIDLRGNTGGELEVSVALASLFYSKKEIAVYEGEYNSKTGNYDAKSGMYIEPDCVWNEGDILVIVGGTTASGAEIFAHLMHRLPNVKVIGFTRSAGCAGCCNTDELYNFSITYTGLVVLDENKQVLIDTPRDTASHADLDEKVELNNDVIQTMFVEHTDYILNYAVKQLED